MVVLVLNCKVCNKLFTKDHLVVIVVVNIVNTRTKGNMDLNMLMMVVIDILNNVMSSSGPESSSQHNVLDDSLS